MLCIEDDSPKVTADIWTGRGSAIPFSAKYLPWFFQRGDRTRARQPTRVAPTNRLRHRGWALHVADLCRPSGIFGVIKNATMRPPGIAFIFVPVLAFLVLSILRLRSSAGARVALAFPLWIILGTQSFRIVVELFLHQLWIDGLVAKMLTFASANVDIYWSVSAPDRLVVDTGARWD
jgi:hypothetical protein